ncbi:MAG: aminopeptidase [Clostridiales bacterium]|nr:aminopeptidase [Clostridiales bacterium]
MDRKNAWSSYSDTDKQALEAISARYIDYISRAKTERECVKVAIELAEAKGYVNMKDVIAAGGTAKPGDRLYMDCMGKSLMLFIVGEESLEKGFNILGAHVDSPRIDVKQNPLYEDSDFAYLDTHYYGGIKKYQWVTLPLAIHGVVVKKDGTMVDVCIGEDDNDPVFSITDLLIHLAGDQMGKSARDVISGEQLDLMVGSIPLTEDDKSSVKDNVMKIMTEKYGFEEEDFLSAELEIVPAGKAREMGFDRSMIFGYGHDDRVCAYAQLEAMFAIEGVPAKTCSCILADKEEIGSVGATGMRAKYFENAVAELMALKGEYSELAMRRSLANCKMLSCDVSAGFDPAFGGQFERKNTAFLGKGVCYNKFTGSGGKSGSNDANPEFIAQLRKIMDDNNIHWQTAELGRVEAGGGGTIAYICALYGMEVIDSGVAVLNMHAPWEIISKADLFEACKAYKAFVLEA